MEALAEEDEPEDSMMTTEASVEKAEEKTHLSERLQQQMQRCVYRPKELTTTMGASVEEDRPEDSATTTEALAEDEE